MMDVVTRGLDLTERSDLDAVGDLEHIVDDEKRDKNGFQKENVYNRLLPYDISVESQAHLMRIKTSLAKCIQLDQETVYEWFIDLERYVDLYGLAFTREDHIYFVKLQFELMVSKNSMDLYYIAYVARCFIRLMDKRFLISSEELELDWRPLYDTYERLLYSSTESIGLRFVPENLESNLSQAIRLSRPHFSIESTQQMLDEWRPMLCPSSVAFQKAVTYMYLFLPTTLPPEHHDKGFKLWFDEVMQMWLSGKVGVAYESKFTLLLSRLSSDCMGFIDWEPYIPRIFNHFKTSLNLNGGMSRPHMRRTSESIDVGPCVIWIIYMINVDGSCFDHISKLFKAIESFYHPSNTDRRWHCKLQQFLYKLPAYYVKRLHRERFKNTVWNRRLTESCKLTEEQTTKFVDALLPVVLTSMFNQAGVRSASTAFRDLSVLRPERVIPPLLDRLYGSYETLTEPHRLLASILCMASVIPAMVRPCKFFPQGPSHVVPLLLNSLPGIDSNDMRKCIAVFRFIATLASHIRMKDYSYLVDERPDLTYEQQQLCLSTGQFEDFVIQFLDKCFILIENTATATFSNLDQESHSKNGEEGMIEAAISSVTLSILAQASEEIQRSAVDKIYYHVKSHIFDTKTQGKAIATLCLACAKLSPEVTLSKFLPHFGRLIQSLTDNDEVFQESILDDELLFSLLLISEIVRCNSPHLLDHKDLIIDVLQRALKLTAKEGYMLGCSILRHLLRGLTDITCCDWRNIDYGDENNQTTEERWPFDNWGHTTHINDLKLRWEIPGPEAREFAKELLETFLRRAVDDLLLWSDGKRKLTREQVQRSLLIVLSSLVGSAPVLPTMKGKVINLCPYEVPVVPMSVQNTGTDPLNLDDGTDIRTWVVESMKRVLVHIKSTNDDDTKSLVLVCEIFATAISYYGYNKTELRLAADRIKSMKSGTQNKLLSSKRESRYLLVERVRQQHRAMLLNKGRPEFTELHLDVFKSLFELAQSHYVEVRIIAQDTIYMILNHFPFSETVLVPLLVDELGKKEIEHNKFKGLLYLVIGRRSYNSIAIDPNWSFLRKLWPVLVESPHSEKPSIVKLFDRICSLVQKGFDTFELRYNFGDNIKRIASQVWSSDKIDLDIYQPPEQQLIERVTREVVNRNNQRVHDYEQLILKLVELIDNPHLHWHRRIVAYSFFTHLMRDDHPLPLPALQLCLSCLISERLSVRTKAIQLVAAQLKLHKRKHIKRKIYRTPPQASELIDQLEAKAERISLNEGEEEKSRQQDQIPDDQPMPRQSEQQPDDCNLLSNSNKWMQYKLSSGSYSREDWDKLVLVDKPHIGFYVWPSVLEVYEPYAKQPQLNRPVEELNDNELVVYKSFFDSDFVDKMVNYFCFEDKNNQDNVRFNINRPNLFKGLFRNFGPCMIEPFRKYVLEYAASTCEQKQKFVIEFLAGLLRGSKHWSYDMLNELRVFSISIMDQITITQENINDWTGLSNYVFRHRDARRYQWLLDHFVTKATSQVESTSPTTTPFIQASRLTLAHYTLIQCEWRAVDHIFPVVIENLRPQDHLLAYANIRNCLASIYSLIYMFDDPTTITKIPTTLADCPKRDEFIESLLPKLAILERGKQSHSHLVVTPDNIKSTLRQDALHNDQVECSPTHHCTEVEGAEKLMTDGLASRYAGKIQETATETTKAAAIASLSMDTETTDESDMELIAETLMKFRQLETNPKSPSALGHLRHHHHHHEHHQQQLPHKDHLDQANEAKVDGKTRPVVSSGSEVGSFEDNLPNLNVVGSTSAVVGAAAGSTADESQERKDAIKLMRLTSCWIIYLICRMKSPVPAEFFKLLPVICETGRESSDPELAADSLAAVAILGSSTLSPGAIVESLKCVRKIIAERSWHARVAAAAFIEIMISSNLFKLLSNEQWRSEIEDIVINHLICDERIEVRESSSLTLSGMIHCEFTKLTPELLDEFKRRANEPLVKRKQPNGIIVIDPKRTVTRHSGILCLCACVDANPYTVPDYLPSILTLLSDHLTDPQPISTTIKKTMSNFRRTHHDNWQSDKTKFTDDQLCILADLLVSPSYYA